MNKKMNTNRNIFKLGVAVFFVALTMIAAACTNGNDVGPKNKDNNKTYTVTGTIELTDGNARSATTSFTRLDNLEYYLKAYKGTKEDHSTDYVVAQPGNGNLNFVFTLPEPGEWYIIATARFNAGEGRYVDVLSNSKEIEVKDQEAVFDFGTITLSVTGYNSETTGSINLRLYDHTNKVSRVSVSATALINEDYAKESTRELVKSNLAFSGTYKPGETERTLNFTAEDIIPSCYDITFSFYGSNNKLLYSCTEAVTVFGGFVTDTWLQGTGGQSAHLVYDSYSNSSKFIITDELLEAFDQSGDVNTPIVLWNNLDSEYEVDSYYEGDVINIPGFITNSTEKTYERNTKAFGKVTDGTEINDMGVIGSNESPVFCFDNFEPTSIYKLEYRTIYKYTNTQSYTGLYKIDDTFTPINLDELISEKFMADGINGYFLKIYPALDYYNRYIFFFFAFNYNGDETVYLGAVDLDETELLYLQAPDDYKIETFDASGDTQDFSPTINAISVDEVEGNLIVCYSNDSPFYNGLIKIKSITFTESGATGTSNGLSFDDAIDDSLTYDDDIFNLHFARYSDRAIVSDLQILNDVLYVALYSYHLVGEQTEIWISTEVPYEPYCDSYFKVGNDYVRKPIYLSNGGIAKVDLTDYGSEGYSFGTWAKQGTKIIGWHTGTIYEDEEGQGARIVTTPPTPEEENNYFYGARKFIAKKPDELVIADDGGYVDMDLDNEGNPSQVNACENKNRVVFVDLYDEAISSVVDVNVSFDTTFAEGYTQELTLSDTYYGCGFTEF